jgi:hypothetical protein
VRVLPEMIDTQNSNSGGKTQPGYGLHHPIGRGQMEQKQKEKKVL